MRTFGREELTTCGRPHGCLIIRAARPDAWTTAHAHSGSHAFRERTGQGTE
jgi:hypothetical protein